ncbi:hypothetical protein AAIA72_12445 [Hahella sp. SMD15-11]|uniref:Uncharacterized protein n=1 Tax=Thermohahella caldifontis TaxID=3142973 RepID=A0AB39UUI3_9GAMM
MKVKRIFLPVTLILVLATAGCQQPTTATSEVWLTHLTEQPEQSVRDIGAYPERWTTRLNTLQQMLDKGDAIAFKALEQLYLHADGSLATTLRFMLAKALPYQPVQVLRSAAELDLSAEDVCTPPFIEHPPEEVLAWLGASEAALMSQAPESGEDCILQLRESRHQLGE